MKRHFYFWGSAMLACAMSMNAAAAGKKPSTDKERLSYAIGVQIGGSLKRQGLDKDIDTKVLGEAITDVLKGHKPRLSEEEMKAAFEKFQKQKLAERAAEGKVAKAAGDKFRAKFKKKKGVKVTKSGIMYQVIKQGKGKKPKAGDTVTVNYTGKLVNGKVFDSSIERGRPATFKVDGVIKGWTEVLQMMPVGSKWHVVIPPDMAYGERGAGGAIGPDETLIFDIELLSIKS